MQHCPYCKAEILGKTDEEKVKEIMKRVKANDAGAIFELGDWYDKGGEGLLQDRAKSLELVTRAAVLGSSKAHFFLGQKYRDEGDLKKAKFHYEAAAMAGHELARCNIGSLEFIAGNKERALKHWTIAASTGNDSAMQNLQTRVYVGFVSRDAIDSILTAYNTSCAEMRSESRDAWICSMMNIRMLQEEQAGRRPRV
jgi:TPR repeat protein